MQDELKFARERFEGQGTPGRRSSMCKHTDRQHKIKWGHHSAIDLWKIQLGKLNFYFFFLKKKLAKHAMGARNPQLGCWSDSHRPAELGSLPTVDLIVGKL